MEHEANAPSASDTAADTSAVENPAVGAEGDQAEDGGKKRRRRRRGGRGRKRQGEGGEGGEGGESQNGENSHEDAPHTQSHRDETQPKETTHAAEAPASSDRRPTSSWRGRRVPRSSSSRTSMRRDPSPYWSS